jgi:ABC-2 type transport system ATP-binding protein
MSISDTVVSTSALTKTYEEGVGVFDLDLNIARGSIVGLIGPSGSGKTTTVHLMTGILTPDSGTVEVLGERPGAFRGSTRARIGFMPQQALLFPDLTLRENLNFAASLYGVPYRRKRTLQRWIDFMEMEGVMDRLPREASGGEARRVMLAGTLIHDPELIFLDEPTAGIDPVLRRKFWDRFGELAEDGKTILVTTQYVGEAAHCDFVAVMAGGRILTIDTPDGLRQQAFGGEMVEVAFSTPPGSDDLASLESNVGHSLERVERDRVRVVVDDEAEARKSISDWADSRGIETSSVESYLAPFDDVFVALVSSFDQLPEVEDAS